MACVLNSGIALACRDNTGGIARIWVMEYESGLIMGLTGSNLDTINSFTGNTASAYEIQQDVEVGSFTQPIETNTENGTISFSQVCEITIPKMNAQLRNTIKILVQGKWRVIIEDQLGQYWLMGYRNAVRVNAGSADLGKAFLDLNGLKITFSNKESEPAFLVSQTALDTIAVAA
jgi:hypothetical protein